MNASKKEKKNWSNDISLRTQNDRISLLKKIVNRLPDISVYENARIAKTRTKTAPKDKQTLSELPLIELGKFFYNRRQYDAAYAIMALLHEEDSENTVVFEYLILSLYKLLNTFDVETQRQKISSVLSQINKIGSNITDTMQHTRVNFLIQESEIIGDIEERSSILNEAWDFLITCNDSNEKYRKMARIKCLQARLCKRGEDKLIQSLQSLEYTFKILKNEPHDRLAWNSVLYQLELLIDYAKSASEKEQMIDTILNKMTTFREHFGQVPYLLHNYAFLLFKKAEISLDEAEQERLLKKCEEYINQKDSHCRGKKWLIYVSYGLRARIAILRASNSTMLHEKMYALHEAIQRCEKLIETHSDNTATYAILSHAYRILSTCESDDYKKRYTIELAIEKAKAGIHKSGDVVCVYRELSENYTLLAQMTTNDKQAYESKAEKYKKLSEK